MKKLTFMALGLLVSNTTFAAPPININSINTSSFLTGLNTFVQPLSTLGPATDVTSMASGLPAVLQPLTNLNLGSFIPASPATSGGGYSNSGNNDGPPCPIGAGYCQLSVSYASNSDFWYGSAAAQGPNGFLTGNAGIDDYSASVALRLQTKDLIGQAIAGVGPEGGAISLQTQTRDGFNQAVVGFNYNPTLEFTGASISGQSKDGFIQQTLGTNGNLTTTTQTSDYWSVNSTNYSGSANNTFMVTPTETQSYGRLNMEGNQINNLAPGTSGTDAVNLNQLRQGLKQSYQGVAGVAALNGIPSLSQGKKFNVGVGVGNYSGETALAVGSNIQITESLSGKLGIGVSSGNTTSSAGLAFGF